jgi:hypothetical protein
MVKYLHISGSPSTYMTLLPIPSEFPDICGKFCFFLMGFHKNYSSRDPFPLTKYEQSSSRVIKLLLWSVQSDFVPSPKIPVYEYQNLGLYSTLLHLPPHRFHCVGGCWDRSQDNCDFGIGCPKRKSLTLYRDPKMRQTLQRISYLVPKCGPNHFLA